MRDFGAQREGITLDGLVRMLRDGRITRRGFLVRAMGLAGSLAAAEGLLARVAGAQTTTKNTLVVGQSADISKLDPHMSTTVNDIAITFNLFDNLLTRRRDGKLYPSLASEWKLVNPTTWQFKLRPNVKFHNGDRLTSADVKFSFERSYDPNTKSITKSILTTIAQIDTPDPLTVVIHTKQPDPLLAARTAFYAGQIMPKAYFQKVGDDEFNAKPIGSGPVKLNSWVKDDRLILDATKDYWGGKLAVDQIIFRPLPELAARIGALLKGEVDLITKIPPDHVERISSAPNTKVEGVLYGGLYCLSVASQKPPLDSKPFRQAMSLAIDRETIVKELWRGQGAVPNSLVVKGDNHHDPSLPPLKFDPNQAKQLLKEANYKGEELTLETPIGFMVMDREMSEVVVSMWKDVGINGKLEQLEYSVYQQKIREKSFKGVRWTDPTSAYNDPDGMMWRHLAPGGPNAYWFRNARFDELGNAARLSVDEKFRGEAYKEMARLELEYLPLIPVIQPMELYGMQRYVDWKPYANQTMEFRQFNLKLRRA
ncbi:MAG TPA: ABC transporter substrate-binding protein [Candidatus Methylomirabilis sp.]|nr:ABC transporter substrate-binding protein [Candidatus Methylomirabilis sp.]